MSVFHKLVLSVFMLHFPNVKAKKISYRNFKDFKKDNFNRDLQHKLLAESVEEYDSFANNFLFILNKHSPLKDFVHANHAPYLTRI